MSTLKEGQEILKEISHKKKRLVEIAENTGLQSIETIECSQELDEMINSFYRCLQQQYYDGTHNRK
jgi:hypothetical protein